MLAFYDYGYFLKDNPPSDEIICFWFAMDQYLENLWDKDGNLLSKLVLDAKDDEERNSYGLDRFRNYVHRIMSVSDDLLNDKEKAFRDWTRVPENQEKFLQAYKKSFFGLEKNNDHVNILDENKLLFCKKVFEKEINEKTEKKVVYYLKYQDPKTKLRCEYPEDIEKKYKELKLIECQEEMNFPNPEYMSYLFHTEPEQLSEVEKEFVCAFLYSPSEYIFYKNMDTNVVCKKIDEFWGWAQKSNYSKDDRENIKQVAAFLENFFDVKIMLHKKLNTSDIRIAINDFRNFMANYKSKDINYVYRFIGNLAKNFFDMDDEPLFRAFEKKIIKEKIYHTKIKRENWNLDGLDKGMLKFLDDKNRIDEFTQKFEEKYHDEKLLNGLINKTLSGEKDMLQDPVGSRRENESELDYMERQFKAYVDLSSKKWMKNETKKQLFKEAVSMSSQVQNNFSQENTMIKTNTRELKQSHVVTGNKTQSSQANKTSSSNIANWLKILLVIILSAALTLILLRFVFQASLLFLILGPSLTSVFCGALGGMYFYKTTQREQAKYLASIKENNLGHKNFAEDQANSQNRSNTNNLKINLEAYKKDIDKKVI